MEQILVVFDMDGVLTDTLPMLEAVYGKFLAGFGIQGSSEEFSGLNGLTIREIVEYLKAVHRLEQETEELLGQYLEKIAGSMGDALLSDGVVETLSFLKERDCRIGIASSAGRDYITTMLETHRVKEYIDFIVSGDDVTKAKPSTEIYERACSQYEYDKCYIIEDSDNGLKAAQIGDERCRVVFYQGTQQFSLERYQYRINHLRQLCHIISQPRETVSFTAVQKLQMRIVEEELCESTWQQEADAVWQQERKEHPELFNGGILCLKSLDTEEKGAVTLQVCPSEYKYYKWAISERTKGNFRNVIPVAVSAMLLDPEGNTLLARRGKVTQYESLYELVPSGSLEGNGRREEEPVFGQVRQELEEELAGTVKVRDIASMQIIGLSCDIPDQVLDVCVLVRLSRGLREMCPGSNDEYCKESLRVMSLEELMRDGSLLEKLVPTSLEIIKFVSGGKR